MFEDQPKAAAAPGNLPMEAEDIFKDVEKTADLPAPPSKSPDALSSGMLKKKEAPPAPSAALTPTPASAVTGLGGASVLSKPILGKILLAVAAVVVVGGVGYAGWWAYGQFVQNRESRLLPTTTPVLQPEAPVIPPTPASEQPVTSPAPTEPSPSAVSPETTSTNVTTKTTNDKILFGEQIDTDKDGLDDVREKEIGTDPNNPDTDGDGLSDGDEVLIWKTNPLNSDTDGDGYPDGKEVRNGYNPLGSGKLFVTPTPAATRSEPATSSK